jgi:hypothetical protein
MGIEVILAAATVYWEYPYYLFLRKFSGNCPDENKIPAICYQISLTK